LARGLSNRDVMKTTGFHSFLRQKVLARTGDSSTPDFREECFLEHVIESLDDHNEVSGAELLRPPYRANSAGRLPAAKRKSWVATRRSDQIQAYTALAWEQLRGL
jgi:hypothetical protein